MCCIQGVLQTLKDKTMSYRLAELRAHYTGARIMNKHNDDTRYTQWETQHVLRFSKG